MNTPTPFSVPQPGLGLQVLLSWQHRAILTQTLPGNLFQEEQSPEKNMFTTVNRIVYRCGEQAHQWKNLSYDSCERSSAWAPLRSCSSPGTMQVLGVTSQGVTCDQGTCRAPPVRGATSITQASSPGITGVPKHLPAATPSPEGTPGHQQHRARAGHSSNLPLRALLGGRGKGEQVLNSKAVPTDQTFLGN